MAITRSFKLAEFIRHMSYNSSTDRLETTKEIQDENTLTGGQTTTATTEVALDSFAHATFRAARYIVAMSEGSNFHSTEIMLVHDGSAVTLTQYGTLKDTTLATFDADINGDNVRLLVTPAGTNSTVIKFNRTTVEA